MKKHLLFILLVILATSLHAQTDATKQRAVQDSFSRFLTKKVFISNNLNYDALFSSPKNHAQLFTFAASFDDDGRIDSIFFSKKLSSHLLKVIRSTAALSQHIIEEGFSDKSLSGKVVIQPVLIKRAGDDMIQFDSDFMEGFSEFWPKLDKNVQAKSLILRDPYLLVYFQPVQ